MEGGTHEKEFIDLKNCVFILTCLNFSPLQSTPHLCNTPVKTFSHIHCPKVFDLMYFDAF